MPTLFPLLFFKYDQLYIFFVEAIQEYIDNANIKYQISNMQCKRKWGLGGEREKVGANLVFENIKYNFQRFCQKGIYLRDNLF